jgi:NhaP-type Na+/H+ or K+/H+ antiporter
MAHYSWYNLSPQGKQSSFIVFQFLGYAVEAFVFSYLGLTFFSYGKLTWSFDLFLVELVILIVGRFIGTSGLMFFLSFFGYRSGISWRELIFIWYAGMIRGAIAFGLVLRIESLNRDVIVTTSLSLVIFTTVVFGSTVGLVSNCLFKDHDEEEKKQLK